MKILFAIGSFCERGGKERLMADLIRKLVDDYSVQVCLICERKGLLYEGLSESLVGAYDYKPGHTTYNIGTSWKAVYEFGPDIIHSWNTSNTFYSILTSFQLNIPIITSEIVDALPESNSLNKIIKNLNYYFSKKIAANSRAGLIANGLLPSKEDKSVVIYNGVKTGDTNLLKVSRSPEKPFVVVMTARLEKVKDHLTVLRAAELAMNDDTSMKFVFLGYGTEFEDIRNLSIQMGLDNVEFRGYVNEVSPCLEDASVGILCTDTEKGIDGVPNAVVEYMAHGLPVIATHCGGTGEVVEEGVHGFLIPNNDHRMLFEKLLFLKENPQLRNSMGEKAHLRIRNEFSLTAMSGRYMELYKEVLEGPESLK